MFGLTEGWWLFSDTQLRPDYPLLAVPQWQQLLGELGFTQTVDISQTDGVEDFGRAVILSRSPEATGVVPTEGSVDVAGLSVSDLTPALAAQLGFPRDAKGALVMGVERGSAAATAGLARGVLIVKVDKAAITTAKEFQQAMATASPEKGALLQVTRPNGESDFVVLKVK